jgi:2-amino-4-hydroxy-6-hydroxymethyldihydropteridine diphosphokinase
MVVTAYLGLGANLGDRLANLQRAVLLLGTRGGLRVARSSRIYETDAVAGPPQPRYLNAVVQVETSLSAHELLAVCLSVENELGRVRAERWGPRTLDIDVMTYDDETVDEPDLHVPHPRMHERAFVLVPLSELDTDPPLPGGRHLASLRLGPDASTGVRPYAPPLTVPKAQSG